ncbi:hypothetical protein LTR47_009535 [Exophiala xenobiotica]|nr:hypothetical protein LTR47_009535 [Exophiala xenobiotica]KAK5249898.1 hypothetical protein LTS06_005253 [Exophiala xenobiotica]KAK5283268.1 hypothetical protein LTR40_002033 [Exophiala xenobiotica]KAK5346914.1 hypothetical protein LTR61_009355 [Exophiala xenobiotica]KAK5360762.1 hypothetical protein LTR11_010098 [Exophiala xenobiotica]
MGLLTRDHIRVVNVLITVFVSLGSFTYGYCSAIISTTLGLPQFYEYLHLATYGPGLSHTNALTGAMNGLFQGGGLFGSLAVGPIADKFSRRGSIAIAAAICLIGGALQTGTVNVAMFLVARFITVCLRDRHDDAYRAIEYLHGDPSDPQQSLAKREYEAVRKQIELDCVKGNGSYKELFTNPANRKRVTIGFLLLFGAQCTATIVIANYGIILYTGLGYTAPTTLAFTAGWVSVAVAGNTITSLFVDRVGRVRFLLIGFCGCLLALVMEMWLLAVYQNSTNKAGQAAAVSFLYIHVGFYSVCVDATTYIYCTEIFPSHLRARGSSVSISGLFFATVIFTCAAPQAFGDIGWKYYIIFAVLTVMMIIIMWFYFPETKGLSLEEINALFGEDVALQAAQFSEEPDSTIAVDHVPKKEVAGITQHKETAPDV